jgi:hypothetical protein
MDVDFTNTCLMTYDKCIARIKSLSFYKQPFVTNKRWYKENINYNEFILQNFITSMSKCT